MKEWRLIVSWETVTEHDFIEERSISPCRLTVLGTSRHLGELAKEGDR